MNANLASYQLKLITAHTYMQSVECRPHAPTPANSFLCHVCYFAPVGSLLSRRCLDVSPTTAAMSASLALSLWFLGKNLSCGAGYWFPEGVSDANPLPPQSSARYHKSQVFKKIFSGYLMLKVHHAIYRCL